MQRWGTRGGGWPLRGALRTRNAAVGCGTLLGGANPGGTTRGEGKPREAPARGHGGGSAAARRVPCVGLHLHRAGRADVLADGVAGLLATPLDDPFATEVVVVPARGVERWLSQRLSHGSGPRHRGARRRLRRRRLPHPLVAGRRDHRHRRRRPVGSRPAGLAAARRARRQPRRAVGRRRWPDTSATASPARRATCAAAGGTPSPAASRACSRPTPQQRPRLLADWTGGSDTDGTRAERRRERRPRRPGLAAAAVAPAGRAGRRAAAARACTPPPWPGCAEEPATVDLPERLSLFGHTRLPATEVELLAALARHRDVHLWLPHPSEALWQALADLPGPVPPTRRPQPRARRPTRCSPPWAATSASCSAPSPPSPLGLRRAPDRTRPGPTRCSAGCRPTSPPTPPGHARARQLAPGDRSVQVHACHGPARQVEVLREVLLGLLADDPTLEPRDILVMCPDIESYAPLIPAGFGLAEVVGEAGHPAHRLRVRLADRALTQTNPLLAVAARLLDLAGGRADRQRGARPGPRRRRSGAASRFTDDDLEQLARWVRESGVRWAFDAAHRADYGLAERRAEHLAVRPRPGARRRRHVRRRPAPGSTAPCRSTTSAATRSTSPAGSPSTSTGSSAATDALVGSHPLGHWLRRPGRRASTRSPTCPATTPGSPARCSASWPGSPPRPDRPDGAELRLPDVRALLGQRLAGRPTRANFRTGTLTVCTMVPMRSVPHRVVCLLGLDDGVFPRAGVVDGDDVLARDPLTGERDPRSEDRQLLLDAIMAADRDAGRHLHRRRRATPASRGRRRSRWGSCSTLSTTRPPAPAGRSPGGQRPPPAAALRPPQRRARRPRRRPAVHLRRHRARRGARGGRAAAPRQRPFLAGAAAGRRPETDVALDDLLALLPPPGARLPAHPPRRRAALRGGPAARRTAGRDRPARPVGRRRPAARRPAARRRTRDRAASRSGGAACCRRGGSAGGTLGEIARPRPSRWRGPRSAGVRRPATAVDVDVDLGQGPPAARHRAGGVRRPAGPGQLLPARRQPPAAVVAAAARALGRRARPQLDRPHDRPARQQPLPRRPRPLAARAGARPPGSRAAPRPGRSARPRADRAAAAAGQDVLRLRPLAPHRRHRHRGAPQGRLRLGRRALPRRGRPTPAHLRVWGTGRAAARHWSSRRAAGEEHAGEADPLRRAGRCGCGARCCGPSRGAGDERSPTLEPFDLTGPLPTGTTVLEASAGTGKTYTVAALVTRYVAEGVARLDELLVITFGRAASQELRERVREQPGGGRARAGRPGRRRRARRRSPRCSLDADAAEARRRVAGGCATRSPTSTPPPSPPPTSSASWCCARLGVAGDTDAGAGPRGEPRRPGRPRSSTTSTSHASASAPSGRPTTGPPPSGSPTPPSHDPQAVLAPADPDPDTRGGARASFAQAVRPRSSGASAASGCSATTTCSPGSRRPSTARGRRRRPRGGGAGPRPDAGPVADRAGRRVPGHRPGAVAGHRAGLRRPRDRGADRRPQAGDLRLPRRRRRHLPRGRGDRHPSRHPRHQLAQRRRPGRAPPGGAAQGRTGRRRDHRARGRRGPPGLAAGGRAAPRARPAASGRARRLPADPVRRHPDPPGAGPHRGRLRGRHRRRARRGADVRRPAAGGRRRRGAGGHPRPGAAGADPAGRERACPRSSPAAATCC